MRQSADGVDKMDLTMLRITSWFLLALVTLVLLLVLGVAAFQQGTSMEVLAGFSGKPLWLIGVLAMGLLLIVLLLLLWLRRKRVSAILLISMLSLGIALGFNSRHAVPDATVQFVSQGSLMEADLFLTHEPDAATVVIVHGSANFPRSFYQYWASQLHAMGLNVLLPDKRGAGQSGGVFVSDNNGSEENLSLLADDVAAAVDHVANVDGINREKIGLFGLSQAGWTAPMAALKQPEIDFMILLTAPTVSTHEEAVWSELRGDDDTAARVSFAEADRIMASTQPEGVDARHALARLELPVLWLFGDQDNSIPSTKSMAVIDQLSADGRPYSYQTYPGFGHVLMSSFSEFRPQLCEAVWQDIHTWLLQQTVLQTAG